MANYFCHKLKKKKNLAADSLPQNGDLIFFYLFILLEPKFAADEIPCKFAFALLIKTEFKKEVCSRRIVANQHKKEKNMFVVEKKSVANQHRLKKKKKKILAVDT